ncbi:MAG: DUF2652 domain-containing protein [Saprospiraceae bacterium]|nr:DUF2652 domain-containing protein [Saprospiraceae bacterium]
MSQTLLFIPDISGFTEFVNNTAVEHSHHIIAELLQELIEANHLGLQLAEIEGDALFFHREGALPTTEELIGQVKKMTVAFHQHLEKYNLQRICQCGSCKTAVNLKLKFVAHTGPIQYIEVAGQRKPYGKDVIQVHRLLKNQVPVSEYLLVSGDLANAMAEWEGQQDQFVSLEDTYDAGVIPYFYTDISHIRQELPPPGISSLSFETTTPLTLKVRVERPPAELFEVISNFKYRKLWNTEPRFIFDESRVNRAGTKHVCVVDDREILFETVKKAGTSQPLVYGERTKDVPLMEYVSNYFAVKENGNGSVIEFELYLQPKNLGGKILAPLIKRQARKRTMKLLHQLKFVAEEKTDLNMAEAI